MAFAQFLLRCSGPDSSFFWSQVLSPRWQVQVCHATGNLGAPTEDSLHAALANPAQLTHRLHHLPPLIETPPQACH